MVRARNFFLHLERPIIIGVGIGFPGLASRLQKHSACGIIQETQEMSI
jgi:hypothetical protein